MRAVSSVGERFLDTEEVRSSILLPPTTLEAFLRMNENFNDLFSIEGARVDNDGIAPGDNLWGAPDPGFTSSEFVKKPRTAPAVPPPAQSIDAAPGDESQAKSTEQLDALSDAMHRLTDTAEVARRTRRLDK